MYRLILVLGFCTGVFMVVSAAALQPSSMVMGQLGSYIVVTFGVLNYFEFKNVNIEESLSFSD